MHKSSYDIQSLIPLISWSHFFHSWNVTSEKAEAETLRNDAMKLLDDMSERMSVEYIFRMFNAKTDGDDMIIGNRRIPFLRQQTPNEDGTCLCITDFIEEDKPVGVFATTVRLTDTPQTNNDPYYDLLLTTISDRLAEAAAELLQANLQDGSWGSQHIIRPAVGYPSIPDMSINFILDELCDFKQIGICLTENGMMKPHSSVSGFIIASPSAHYFAVGPISEEQLRDYASRREYTIENTKRYIYAQTI